jgi:hypothetical protein
MASPTQEELLKQIEEAQNAKAPETSPEWQDMLARGILALAPALGGYAFGGAGAGAAASQLGMQGLKDFETEASKSKEAKAKAFSEEKKTKIEGLTKQAQMTQEKELAANAERVKRQIAEMEAKNKKEIAMIEANAKKAGAAPTGKPLTSEQTFQLSAHEAAFSKLDDLDKVIDVNKDIFGPVAGRKASYNPWDEQGKTVDAALKLVAQDVGKALEGGKLTDADISRYRAMLPQVTDTPEIAKGKLAQVKRMVAQKQMADLKILQQSGYNVAEIKGREPEAIQIMEGKDSLDFLAPSAQAAAKKPDFSSMSQEELKKYLQGK